jgi:penicillin amidase
VPHIYAEETSDAYYALGYVMAQDRIFEMDLFRRSVAGRLSEIFGPSMLQTDMLMRTLGIYKIAQDSYASIPPDIKANLEQFARGVNRYIREWPDGIPLEYRLLSLKFGVPLSEVLPYPWTPADSVAIAGMMGLMLTDTSSKELIRGAFMKYVEPSMPGITDFLMPLGWINATTIMDEDPPIGEAALIQSITQPLKEFLGFSSLGSNNWVISPAKSATGNALLCNDPHLDLRTPGINWEVHIKTNEFNVIGVMIPGGPGGVLWTQRLLRFRSNKPHGRRSRPILLRF